MPKGLGKTPTESTAAAAQAAQEAEANRQAQKQEAAAVSARRKHDVAAEADKKRQEGYVDQLRSLEIQRQQLELDAAKARVNRENEFIDQELQENAARTDAIKAAAEADRNVSLGAKSYLEHAGANAEIGGPGNAVAKP